MKMSKNNSNVDEVTKIKNHFTYLKLGELNSEPERFVEENIEFFMNSNSAVPVRIQVLEEKRGIELSKNGSTFKMLFLPNYVNPSSVKIELINLGHNLQQSYIINFASEVQNSVAITYRKRFSSFLYNETSSSSLNKTKTEIVYINGKRRYYNHLEHFIGKHINEDSSYSKEETICYSALDDSYVKSTIVVAEPRAYCHTSVSYEKYDGKDFVSITGVTFGEETEKFTKERAKVFTIRKDN